MRSFVACLLFALVAALLTPSSAGAQTDAECVAVYDADGTRVARAGVGSDAPAGDTFEVKIFLAHSGVMAQLGVRRDTLEGNAQLFFTSANCTGNAFMARNTIQPQAHLVGTDVWYPDTLVPVLGLTSQSVRQAFSGTCQTTSDNIPAAAPALNFTLPTFTPPFHLEPEPCSTPPDPDPEQFINGCISKNGTLKIVADPADCTARETPITLLGP